MKYFTDGFVIGQNPSSRGGGYVVTDENMNLIKKEIIKKSKFTNNDGEILGIQYALQVARENDTISTDSMCALSWVNSGKSKARPDLFSILSDCKRIRKEKNINLMWEEREFNVAGIYCEMHHESGTLY